MLKRLCVILLFFNSVLALFIGWTLVKYPEILWIVAVMVGAVEIPDH